MENRITGLHHITMCTGTAQADIDFFVKVMGQRFVKRTLFYDGREPIYHLYFADRLGTPGTVMTTFPTRRTGLKGRKGANQFTVCSYAIPRGSLPWWKKHLAEAAIPTSEEKMRFGQPYISFAHPGCGIDFEVVEDGADTRVPWESPNVPKQHAARGFHSWTASVRELEDMEWFLYNAWNFEKVGVEGQFHRYRVRGENGPGKTIDLLHEPARRQGTWTIGEGTIHHGAFAVPNLEVQAAVKFDTEGFGFTDFSDRKNRGYFESIYVRTPGGVMFEATHSLGFTHDEPEQSLGLDLKLAPNIVADKEELVRRMNDPIRL
jgi:catechol 2,3-dioxygenase-like lactoylglutathione lyase family enzyme